MGIPALFRWLSTKYPKVTSQVVEEMGREINGVSVPCDSTKPNPNNIEFDNLYLDMNGIIHPCCHPEDAQAPATEDEMYLEIFKYIDRICRMIRPRKLIYMAIDGVAPRAKMNQQRSRRFRASREEQLKVDSEANVRKKFNEEHPTCQVTEPEVADRFDSNCITPGTPFMDRLAECLRYYITDRLNNDPGWKNVKVILSDASVPGEGEHKVMDYIRRQRNQTTYDCNTRHVLYGLDADLIMLALATHEPHFWILREDVFFNEGKRGCFICGQNDHMAAVCTGKKKEIVGTFDDQTKHLAQKPFVFLHVSILREYLEVEMKVANLSFKWDLERAMDDWVFLCFFVGNDFLPHLPSLELREGAIDKLIAIWKRSLNDWGGFITNSGDINLNALRSLMSQLGLIEDEAFQNRRDADEGRRKARLRRKKEQNMTRNEIDENREREHKKKINADPGYAHSKLESYPVKMFPKKRQIASSAGSLDENELAAKKLKVMLGGGKLPVAISVVEFQSDKVLEEGGNIETPTGVESLESKEPLEGHEIVEALIDKPVDSDDESPKDDVRLWESGWKHRYYQTKFQVDVGDEAFRKKVAHAYMEGLSWVLRYYYQGVASWQWFFPFHYSPFASDFYLNDVKDITFEIGRPFKPFEQLMGVLPAASRAHIPSIFHHLMLQDESPILDFYPTDFPIDLNGKKYEWQGVALLPFIEADRLLKNMMPLYGKLNPIENKRNSLGDEILFVDDDSMLFDFCCPIYGKKLPLDEAVSIDPLRSDRLNGMVKPDPNVVFPALTFPSPLTHLGLEDIPHVQSLSVVYKMPAYSEKFKYPAKLISNVKLPYRILTNDDIEMIRTGDFAHNRGRGGRGRGRGSDRYGGSFHARPMERQGLLNSGKRDSSYEARPQFMPRVEQNYQQTYQIQSNVQNTSYQPGYRPQRPQFQQQSYQPPQPRLNQDFYGQSHQQQQVHSPYGSSPSNQQQKGYQQQSYQQHPYTNRPPNALSPYGGGYQPNFTPNQPSVVDSLLSQLPAAPRNVRGNLGWSQNVRPATQGPPNRGGRGRGA